MSPIPKYVILKGVAMASITKNRVSDSWYIQIVWKGKRRKIYGFKTKKQACFIGERLELLKDCLEIGCLSREVKYWLVDIWHNNPALYQKLVDLKMAEPREECGTLNELIRRYVVLPISGRLPKKRTSRNRQIVGNMLLHILADQPLGNIKGNEKALEKAGAISADAITIEKANEIFTTMQETYQPATWGRRIKHLQRMFEYAVSLHWMEINPFGHLRGTAPANASRFFFVGLELAEKVLEACPDSRWRLIFTLGRWGGLRIPSELAFLRWSEIDWDGDKMKINVPKKTSRIEQERGNFAFRWLPLFPEIRKALEEYRDEYEEPDEDFVFPELDGSESDGFLLRRELNRILKDAKIRPWQKLFVNLRATRDTELQNRFPVYQVGYIMGHTPQVSLKHYAQVTDDVLKQMAYPQ